MSTVYTAVLLYCCTAESTGTLNPWASMPFSREVSHFWARLFGIRCTEVILLQILCFVDIVSGSVENVNVN